VTSENSNPVKEEITQPREEKECTAEEIFPNAPRKKKNLG
jgi:hypothetical protein